MNVLILIIGLLVVAGSIIASVGYNYYYDNEKKFKPLVPLVLLGVLLIIISQSFAIIPTGYSGVRTTFGIVTEKTVPNGFNYKIPLIQRIVKVNNKKQDITYKGKVWSESSERTAMYYEQITITYQINPEKSAWIYSNVDNYENVLMSGNLVASAIKSVSKKLPAVDATNRAIIEPMAQEAIQNSLNSKYGEDVIAVIKVIIENVDFEDSYNAAIAEKMNEQLLYEKQQIENTKEIEKAEAQAKAKLVLVNAEADTILYEAEAQAKANQLITQSWSESVAQQKYLETWNGDVPKIVGSTSDILFDVSDIIK